MYTDNRVERKLSPADIDAAILSQQDVGDVPATAQQGMLDVSARRLWARVLWLGSISGETNLQVVQSTTGHEALQLLPENTSGESSGQLQTRNFPCKVAAAFTKRALLLRRASGELMETMESEWMC